MCTQFSRQTCIHPPPKNILRSTYLPTQQFTHIVGYYNICLLNYINIKKSGRGGGYKNTEGPNPYPVTNNMGKLLGR